MEDARDTVRIELTESLPSRSFGTTVLTDESENPPRFLDNLVESIVLAVESRLKFDVELVVLELVKSDDELRFWGTVGLCVSCEEEED